MLVYCVIPEYLQASVSCVPYPLNPLCVWVPEMFLKRQTGSIQTFCQLIRTWRWCWCGAWFNQDACLINIVTWFLIRGEMMKGNKLFYFNVSSSFLVMMIRSFCLFSVSVKWIWATTQGQYYKSICWLFSKFIGTFGQDDVFKTVQRYSKKSESKVSPSRCCDQMSGVFP